LSSDQPFNTGTVPADFLVRLKQFVDQSGESADALWFGGFGGYHTCELCDRAHGSANFGVPDKGLLFVVPEMVVHYIVEHEYLPPADFIKAVMRSPLPESEEYQLITEPFWHMHRAALGHE
jgi:hypothetical protein